MSLFYQFFILSTASCFLALMPLEAVTPTDNKKTLEELMIHADKLSGASGYQKGAEFYQRALDKLTSRPKYQFKT